MIPIAQQITALRAAATAGIPDDLTAPQRRILTSLTRRWMTTAGVVRLTSIAEQAARRHLGILADRGLVERGDMQIGDRKILAWRRAGGEQ